MRTWIVIAIVALCFDVAHAGKTKRAKANLKVAGMNCEGCTGHVERGLSDIDGVESVKANVDKRRVVVVYDPDRLDESRIRTAIEEMGYVVGDKDPPVVYPKGADLKVLSKAGEDVRIKKHLAAGKVTVVDFYADWCKPCKTLDRRLAARAAKYPKDFAVRKVNIVSWDTPVAKRYMKGVAGLPYVRVFDAKGKFIVALSGEDVEKKLNVYLDKLQKKLSKRKRSK